MEEIYMDNATTSWPKPDSVYEEVLSYMKKSGASPGRAGYKRIKEADHILDETRASVAKLFNIKDPKRIIFTPGATYSLNLAIKGILKPGDHVITTTLEHNSILRPLSALVTKKVCEVTYIEATAKGHMEPSLIEKKIKENTRLIIVNHASNVLGTITPIEEIGKIAQKRGIPFLVDGAQTSGLYPIDVVESSADLLAFSGHKGLLGFQGIGGLYIREGIELDPLVEGGTGTNSESTSQPTKLPDRYESGTLNIAGIISLREGIRFIEKTGLENIRKQDMELTHQLFQSLKNIEGIRLYGPEDPKKRLAIISFSLKGYTSQEISNFLDRKYHIITRSGLHCAPLVHKTLGTLKGGLVRVSLGFRNTSEEVEQLIKAIRQLAF